MKRFLMIVCVMLFAVSFGFSMSAKDVGKSLKGWKDKNYSYGSETDKDSGWKVTYSYSDSDYTVFILIADDVVNAADKNVVIYCDVLADSSQPSEDTLFQLLKLNIEDGEWGFFSLYNSEDDDTWYVQYNIKFRLNALDDSALKDAIQYTAEACGYYKDTIGGN
jgi:hypothetical protein